jgi:hypothetical protein
MTMKVPAKKQPEGLGISMKNRQRNLHNNNLEANMTMGAIITLQESLTNCQTITFITVTTTMTTTN